MVRYFVAPGIWLALGLLGVFMPAHLSSEKYLSTRTEQQRQDQQAALSHGMQSVLNGAIGLFCLVNTLFSAWTGRGFWWMWMLATIAHIAALLSRQRAVNRLIAYAGEEREVPTRQERIRQRYVVAFVTTSALAFAVGQAVMPPQSRAGAESGRVIVSVVLLIIAGVMAVAAGWSAVWTFKNGGERT